MSKLYVVVVETPGQPDKFVKRDVFLDYLLIDDPDEASALSPHQAEDAQRHFKTQFGRVILRRAKLKLVHAAKRRVWQK